MNTPDSDLYPSDNYIDPLTFPIYLQTDNSHSLYQQVLGDWLLNAYICQLDQEIIDDIEEFGEYSYVVKNIIDYCRIFGWCVVAFYEDAPMVFNTLHKEDWITQITNDKKERVGIKVLWTDDLGNNWKDDLIFDNNAKLIIWEKGSFIRFTHELPDALFARNDINLSIHSLSIQCRQIKAQLDYLGCNPSFKFFKYGENITPTQRTTLVQQMAYIKTSNAFGAKGSIVDSIETITDNGSIDTLINALITEIGFFSGATRLPLSFYLGERQAGGLGDTGESTDVVKIDSKKNLIMQHLSNQIEDMFSEHLGMNIEITNFYKKQKEEKEAKKDEMLQISQQNQKDDEIEKGS